MTGAPDTRWAHQMALSAILVAAAAELLLRNTYHQMAGETGSFVRLAAVWLALSAVLWLPTRWMTGGARERVGRFTVLLSLAWYSYVLLGGAIGQAIAGGRGAGWLLAALCAAFASLVFWLNELRWERTRRALVVACVAFVASAPLLATYRAGGVSWPPAAVAPTRSETGKSLTVFVLLDEMNAGAAEPLAALLRGDGLQVAFRPIRSVGEHTLTAVPAMFIKADFSQAKPCGPSSICSDGTVLDFSRVRASRDDIDVVGFFHPYCAMQGLRSCAQIAPRTGVLDAQRWRCAALRRLRAATGTTPVDCDREPLDAWQAFVDEAVAAVWALPAWRQGGFVFAHLPLPHPPGPFGGTGLAAAYAHNVQRANDLVRDMHRRARAEGVSRVSIVVFSDHALRQSLWCRTPPYVDPACPGAPGLSDTHVPLIVASTEALPELSDMQTNAQIFDVAVRLP